MPKFRTGLFDDALSAFRSGESARAEAMLSHLLEVQPQHFDGLKLLGYMQGLEGRASEAALVLEKAVLIQPRDLNVRLNLGKALGDCGRLHDAIVHFRQASVLQPSSFGAWFGLGCMTSALGRHAEALELFSQALAIDATAASAWCNRANSLASLLQHVEALADYDRALCSEPSLTTAWAGKAATLMELGRHEEARQHYDRALELDPALPFIAGQAMHLSMLCCEWSGLQARLDIVTKALTRGMRSADPFGFQAISTDEAELKACAEIYAADTFPPVSPTMTQRRTQRSERIKLGYLCGEFRNQATSVLMAGLYEMHDRDRFELFAFDSGWNDGSAMRKRIESTFEHWVPIAKLGDDQAADVIRGLDIDILVNLNGYFGQVRQGIFARRAAPLQVNFLGFPGTLGAEYMDYLIADAIVIPPESRRHYTEKIAYLPGSYQPNDQNREISAKKRERSEFGLPEVGFVYCCFNNSYKILPSIFDRWMRILRRVDHSVLWLLRDNPLASENLRAEAARRDVDPCRLVFAEREPLPEHLARHGNADLFLDTSPYNAHTTASDALYAGLPLLTVRGNTFPGRVAESLLRAAGVPELVAPDGDTYERIAIDLANDPASLDALRRKLVIAQTALFDPQGYARRIEAAYVEMYQRLQAGLPPAHLTL
jgi:predicted O-linked N-acetylglucosamine transferase (SPINDLY family)